VTLELKCDRLSVPFEREVELRIPEEPAPLAPIIVGVPSGAFPTTRKEPECLFFGGNAAIACDSEVSTRADFPRQISPGDPVGGSLMTP
jgi:hypothetical protein